LEPVLPDDLRHPGPGVSFKKALRQALHKVRRAFPLLRREFPGTVLEYFAEILETMPSKRRAWRTSSFCSEQLPENPERAGPALSPLLGKTPSTRRFARSFRVHLVSQR
jgi:hypothetical protein